MSSSTSFGRDRRRPRARIKPNTAATRAHDPDLRARLLTIIGAAIGLDRQCHLPAEVIAKRVRVDRWLVVVELRAMQSDNLIQRFRRENGQTAIMLLAQAASDVVNLMMRLPVAS